MDKYVHFSKIFIKRKVAQRKAQSHTKGYKFSYLVCCEKYLLCAEDEI